MVGGDILGCVECGEGGVRVGGDLCRGAERHAGVF